MKNIKLRTGIITLLCICFGVFFSSAQSEREGRKKPPTFDELLEKMDENEDGMLSQDEIKGPLKEHFSEADANEDGLLTKEEFEKMPKPERGKRPSRNK